ncbi:glycyl radical protein [Desulfovibrio sp. OttesenSCG-928-I05]|nr:glycyl radical protein [Desulfovibrio sp. OttesenSCG-928-I05]
MYRPETAVNSPRERTRRIAARFVDSQPLLSVERARLFTASFKTTEHLPLVLRWAMAVAHVMRHIDVRIFPDELIVGRGGPEGRYGILYPELEGAYFSLSGTLLEKQEGMPHQFTSDDLAVIRDELLPFWAGRTFRESLAYSLPDDLRRLVYKDGDIYTPSMVIYESATVRHSLQWVLDYKKVIERGFEGLHAEASELLRTLDINNPRHNWDKAPFYRAVIVICEAMRDFALRHAECARTMAASCDDPHRRQELETIADICSHVPWKPARTFHEALQAQWFTQLAARFEQMHGGIVGNGRVDQYLYPLYQKDREAGRLNEAKTMELLDCLWLNMAQFLRLQPTIAGLQIYEGNAHWEHTTLGGVLADGKDAVNELSLLVLRSRREMPLPYPDVCVRMHPDLPQDFLEEVVQTIKSGCGAPKFLNDAEIIPVLRAKGIEEAEARDYCGSGCSEVRLINRDTYLTGTTWVNLAAVLEMALYNGHCSMSTDKPLGLTTGDPRKFTSYEAFEEAFLTQLRYILRQTLKQLYITDTLRPSQMAAPLISALHDLCMAQGRDISEGNLENSLRSGCQVGITGFATVVDSLAAIRYLIYEQGLMDMDRLLQVLSRNFEGFEVERHHCRNAPKYGNCIAAVDAIGRKLEQFMVEECQLHVGYYGGQPQIIYVPVTSHIAMGRVTGALPNGRRAGEALSAGISPSPGAARSGPTAVLHSVAETKYEAGTARAARMLDIPVPPRGVDGPEGTRNLAAFIRVWCAQKHWHLHLHMEDEALLRTASNDPEKFRFHPPHLPGYASLPNDLTPEMIRSILSCPQNFLE